MTPEQLEELVRAPVLPPQAHTFGRVEVIQMGWWAISGEAFLDALRRAHDGEDPDLIYAEHYANSDHEDYRGEQ